MIEPAELQAIRDAAEATMRDTCQIGVRGVPTGDDPGAVDWTYGDVIKCGYHPQTRSETTETGAQVTITEATIRLPWGTVVGTEDRVRVVSQSGEAFTVPPVYAATGATFGSLATFMLKCHRITEASTL